MLGRTSPGAGRASWLLSPLDPSFGGGLRVDDCAPLYLFGLGVGCDLVDVQPMVGLAPGVVHVIANLAEVRRARLVLLLLELAPFPGPLGEGYGGEQDAVALDRLDERGTLLRSGFDGPKVGFNPCLEGRLGGLLRGHVLLIFSYSE